MDAVVQLIRNGLCCMKDLNIFPESIFYQSIFPSSVVHPINETTVLEFCIGITQLYACVSVAVSGFTLFYNKGYKALQKQKLKKKKKEKKTTTTTLVSIQEQRYEKDITDCYRNMFIGFLVLCIGIAFFWLFANSLHITQTDWIGGLPGLIHALTIMEMALVPLLYFMISDSIRLIGKAAVMEYLAQILQNCSSKGVIPSEIITDSVLTVLQEDGDDDPFWNGKTQIYDDNDDDAWMADLSKNLELWTEKGDEKSTTTTKLQLQEKATHLATRAVVTRYEAYRELVYFVLNFIAFYGYFLGILTYYNTENEGEESASIRILKLGMTHTDADWTGNFTGDLMWTIEPMIILTSPTILNWLKPSKKEKTKQD